MPNQQNQPLQTTSMPIFSEMIAAFWREQFGNGEVLYHDEVLTLTINPDLSDANRVMVLAMTDGKVMAVLTPALADKAGLTQQAELTEAILRQKLIKAGVTLHGADYLFYFTEADKNSLMQEAVDGDLRQLTEQDHAVFFEFQASSSEQDLDDAYVELDHWAVFGSFEQNRLVSAASMYPWLNSHIADTGVLTLNDYRGKGHARRVVRSISKYSYAQGYEPQYRCQLDNHASTSLARAAGLTLFGKWEVVSPDSAN
ncbi:GNAT family N-acetyltransferase [Paenibacillus sp. NAIST15-1]|uniref:GNAT family N-acetyltransferase n=1 Tax=Paenibacillus sp. NAIST15-1 TaxID=1605994 RepID=UPI000AF58123|nr:GNAT family N-acetyltransferase [Paenibacillus sp. NAIST15-1]